MTEEEDDLNNKHDFTAIPANGLLKLIRKQRIISRRYRLAFLKAVKKYRDKHRELPAHE
jgi:hypothetical protein